MSHYERQVQKHVRSFLCTEAGEAHDSELTESDASEFLLSESDYLASASQLTDSDSSQDSEVICIKFSK